MGRRRRRTPAARPDSGKWCKRCLELPIAPVLESERVTRHSTGHELGDADRLPERAEGVEYRPKRRRPTPFPGPRCKTHHAEVTKARSDARKTKHIADTFELTEEEYRDLLKAQGGVCYICRKKPGQFKRLSVDHDHALAKLHDHPVDKGCKKCIRGLLHSRCNSYLGWTLDDPEAWLRGADYLINPPARKVFA